ncbi:MAG: hypothetical protein E7089_06240 [Bacteroidales bacterium]|nr:hypothetical protein [Bacteroidales bacterium]
MIYATHKLYDCMQRVTTFQVVETKNGCVSDISNFECEKHSMQWYDAIVLSSNKSKGCFLETFVQVLEYLACTGENNSLYAYGIICEPDGCTVTQLL